MRTLISLFILSFLVLPSSIIAQSKTTEELHEEYEDVFYLYFYENTLKMLNQSNDKEFAELIEDIEKMKLLRFDKSKYDFDRAYVRSLMKKYQADSFEELMSMRDEDADIKVYIKEKDKITYGLVMLINDDENLAILDIKGSVPLNKLVSLYNTVKEVNN